MRGLIEHGSKSEELAGCRFVDHQFLLILVDRVASEKSIVFPGRS